MPTARPLPLDQTLANPSLHEAWMRGAHNAWRQGLTSLSAWLDQQLSAHPDVVKHHDVQGHTLLETAIVTGNPAWRGPVVQRLLAAGADPNRRVPAHDLIPGATPLILAVQAGALDALDVLLDGGARTNPPLDADPFSPWGCETTALHEAVQQGSLPAVERLLEAGAHVNACDLRQRSPLWLACCPTASSQGTSPPPSLEVIDRLIAAGANVNERWSGRSPLPFALVRHRASAEVWRRLLSAGMDPNAREAGTRDTALAQLCNTAQPDMACVNALLEGGANPRTVNVYGNTPLHFATSQLRTHWPLVTRLVDAGASLNVKNQDGDTPKKFLNDDLAKLKTQGDPAYEEQVAIVANLKERSTLVRAMLSAQKQAPRAERLPSVRPTRRRL